MARNKDTYEWGLEEAEALSPEPKRRKRIHEMTDDEFKAQDDEFWEYMDRKYGKHNAEETTSSKSRERKVEPYQTSLSYYERIDPKTGQWEKVYYQSGYTPSGGGSYTPYVYVPKPRTSDSHPIDVDYFPSWAMPLRGRLGMTFAPGKTQEKGLMGDHARDLDKDLAHLKKRYGMTTLVTLNETAELEALKIPRLREICHEKGFGTIWYPFADMTPPPNMDHAVELVGMILDRVAAGENVIIHCKGGLGRTGCVAGCALVEMGFKPSDAIATVRQVRPHTIQMKSQEDFIYRYWWYRS